MNLSEMFARSRGEPVSWGGRLVHASYERRVSPGEQLTLTVVSARDVPLQGIRMKLRGGRLQIAEFEPVADVVLWTNSAPPIVRFRCVTKKPAELRVWNCWEDERRVMQAWIGNAGLEIEELGHGGVRLRCNARHEVTFDDLVFELRPGGGP